MYITLGISLLFWPIRKIGRGHFSLRTPIDGPILLLAIMGGISVVISPLPEESSLQVARLFSGVALFYAIYNWTNTQTRLEWLQSGVTLATLLLAIAAPFSVEWSISKLPFISASFYQRFRVAFADAIHPNVLAGTLVFFLPIPLAMLLYRWKGLSMAQRALTLAAVLFACLTILLTKARNAWLTAFAIGLMFIIWRWRRGWIALPLIASATGLVVWRIGLAEVVSLATSSGSIQGFPERLQIWQRAAKMIIDFPLTGIGMGTFQETTQTLYPIIGINSTSSYEHAHNLFLQIGVDLGLIGLAAYLWLFGIILSHAWKMMQLGKRIARPFWLALGAGLVGSQIALLIHGLLDAVTWGMVRSAPLVWAVWGIGLCGWHILTEEASKSG